MEAVKSDERTGAKNGAQDWDNLDKGDRVSENFFVHVDEVFQQSLQIVAAIVVGKSLVPAQLSQNSLKPKSVRMESRQL